MPTSTRGYTLLELLIAMAVLATCLTVLGSAMVNASKQGLFAHQISVASTLASAKMTDIEYELMEEGFPTGGRSMRGDFRKEGRPDMIWEAEITVVEIPELAKEELLAKINTQLFGGVDGAEGALQGNAAFSSMLPMIIGQMPELINRVGQKVRRVDLTVYFPYGSGMFPVEITQYITDQQNGDFDVFGPGSAAGAGVPGVPGQGGLR
jgi:prepilin-type N-terminal cleavage/methylation domain-containing protein